MPLTDFRYVPTSGDLTGKSFEEQTERAFNELGVDITNIEIIADKALEIANDAKAAADAAVQTAQNAEQLAGEANQKAEQAQTAADNAQASADIAQASADKAQSTANQALSTSTAAQSTSNQAVALANQAQTTADEAKQGVSDNKEQIEALWSAQYALGGIYETKDEAIDFDLYAFTFKIYATNSSCTGLPEGLNPANFPIFIKGSYNSTNTACFQVAFSENAPEITYIRTGELSDDPVNGIVSEWGEWEVRAVIAGPGLILANDGVLSLDLAEGSGLVFDSDDKLYFDPSQMPTAQFEALLASISNLQTDVAKKAPRPTNDMVQPISAGSGAAIYLPGGGTWAYFCFRIQASTGALEGSKNAGVAAGGASIGTAYAGFYWMGFAWRVSD